MAPGELVYPWLAFVVLGLAAAATLATLGGQVWGLPAAIKAAITRPSDDRGPQLGRMLAASAGMGSIAAAALAITAGGPGAVLWMWIAAGVGMALHGVEAALGAKPSGDDPGGPWMRRHLGAVGRPLGMLVALGTVGAAIVIGGLLQAHQGAAVLRATVGIKPLFASVIIAAAALPAAVVPAIRRRLFALAPILITAYVGIGLLVVLRDPLATSLALGAVWEHTVGVAPALSGTAAGGITVALYHGVMRSTMASGSGLAIAATTELGSSRRKAMRLGLLVPLCSTGIIGTLTATVVLLGLPSQPVTDGGLIPMARHESRGLRPSPQVGQTVVLPVDTAMEAHKAYAMVARSNPRGHALGQFAPDQNAVFLPHWEVAQEADTIVFRDAHKVRGKNPAWDLRLACDRETATAPDGVEFLKLTPKDQTIDLRRLVAQQQLERRPYVVVGDFHFQGAVGRAISPDEKLGEHLAMFEQRAEDAAPNPKLHEFFRAGFRGPYHDDGSPRGPWGFVAREGFDAEPGTVVHLRLMPPPRGVDMIRVTQSGALEVPAWDFLMDVRHVIVRHRDGPGGDLRIPVTPSIDRRRIRLEATDPQWEDFRRVGKMSDYSGPYLAVAPFDFDAEVRGGSMLAPDRGDRRTLIPLHEIAEPTGAPEALPYAPHPGEVMVAGFEGPVFAHDGAQLVGAGLSAGLGGAGPMVVAILCLLFAVTAIAAWSEIGGHTVASMLGARMAGPATLLCTVAAAAGAAIGLHSLLGWVDAAIAVVLIPNAVGLVLVIPSLRRRLKGEPAPTESAPPASQSESHPKD